MTLSTVRDFCLMNTHHERRDERAPKRIQLFTPCRWVQQPGCRCRWYSFVCRWCAAEWPVLCRSSRAGPVGARRGVRGRSWWWCGWVCVPPRRAMFLSTCVVFLCYVTCVLCSSQLHLACYWPRQSLVDLSNLLTIQFRVKCGDISRGSSLDFFSSSFFFSV